MKKILAVSAAVSLAAMTAVVAEAATATQAELSVVCKDNEVNGVKAGEIITAKIITDNDGAAAADFSIKVTGLEMILPVFFNPDLSGNQSGNDFSVTFNDSKKEFKKGDSVCTIEFKVIDPNNMSIEIVPNNGTATGSVPVWERTAQTDNSSSDNSSAESSTDNSSNESSTETSSATTSAESSSTTSAEQSSSADSNKSDGKNVDTGVAGFAVMSVVLLAGASVVLARKK